MWIPSYNKYIAGVINAMPRLTGTKKYSLSITLSKVVVDDIDKRRGIAPTLLIIIVPSLFLYSIQNYIDPIINSFLSSVLL